MKDPLPELQGNAGPVVGDNEFHASIRGRAQRYLDAARVKAGRIPRVHEQVQNQLMEPRSVAYDIRRIVRDVQHDGNRVRAPRQHGRGCAHLGRQGNRTPAAGLIEGNRAERAGERRAPLRLLDDRRKVRGRISASLLRIRAARLRGGHDRGEQVVQIVSEAAGESRNCFAPLTLSP